jgi:hypothetical protein
MFLRECERPEVAAALAQYGDAATVAMLVKFADAWGSEDAHSACPTSRVLRLDAACALAPVLVAVGFRHVGVTLWRTISAHVRTFEHVYRLVAAMQFDMAPLTFPWEWLSSVAAHRVPIVQDVPLEFARLPQCAAALASWPVVVGVHATGWDAAELLQVYAPLVTNPLPGGVCERFPPVVAGGYVAALVRARLAGAPAGSVCVGPAADVDVFHVMDPSMNVLAWACAATRECATNMIRELVHGIFDSNLHAQWTKSPAVTNIWQAPLLQAVQCVPCGTAVCPYTLIALFDLTHCQAAATRTHGVVFTAAALHAWLTNTTRPTMLRRTAPSPPEVEVNALRVRLVKAASQLNYAVPDLGTTVPLGDMAAVKQELASKCSKFLMLKTGLAHDTKIMQRISDAELGEFKDVPPTPWLARRWTTYSVYDSPWEALCLDRMWAAWAATGVVPAPYHQPLVVRGEPYRPRTLSALALQPNTFLLHVDDRDRHVFGDVAVWRHTNRPLRLALRPRDPKDVPGMLRTLAFCKRVTVVIQGWGDVMLANVLEVFPAQDWTPARTAWAQVASQNAVHARDAMQTVEAAREGLAGPMWT